MKLEKNSPCVPVEETESKYKPKNCSIWNFEQRKICSIWNFEQLKICSVWNFEQLKICSIWNFEQPKICSIWNFEQLNLLSFKNCCSVQNSNFSVECEENEVLACGRLDYQKYCDIGDDPLMFQNVRKALEKKILLINFNFPEFRLLNELQLLLQARLHPTRRRGRLRRSRKLLDFRARKSRRRSWFWVANEIESANGKIGKRRILIIILNFWQLKIFKISRKFFSFQFWVWNASHADFLSRNFSSKFGKKISLKWTFRSSKWTLDPQSGLLGPQSGL